MVGCVIDDSQRKRAEAESLRQQQQITHLTRVAMLGELSGALAHELQQPLTSIMCNAEAAQLLAAKAHFNIEEVRDILEDIVCEDKRAGQIIQHLRSLLMRGELDAQRLEIADVLRDVLKLARGTLTERNVQVHSQIEEGVLQVLGNRVELQQVFSEPHSQCLRSDERKCRRRPADRDHRCSRFHSPCGPHLSA